MIPARTNLTWLMTVLLALPALAQGPSEPRQPHLPTYFSNKLGSTPDLMQTEPRAGLDKDGGAYCGPVAVSNGLMCLAKNGYGRLAPAGRTPFEVQGNLVRLLVDPTRMGVDDTSGTQPWDIDRGLRKYVEEHGYEIERLEYQGWRPARGKFTPMQEVPNLDWMRAELIGPSLVCINVGWYRKLSGGASYERVGGHWMTLAGYGKQGPKNYRSPVLLVYDPSPRSGRDRLLHEIHPAEIPKDVQLTGTAWGLPHSAAGYQFLRGDVKYPKKASTAILDGVVVMRLKPLPPETSQLEIRRNP